MAIVIDASVTVSWLFPDEHHPDAAEAWARADSEPIWVPPHWWFEIRNTVLTGERRGRFTQERANLILGDIAAVPATTAPPGDDRHIIALARRHSLSFYDAAYLELAMVRNLTLATLDRALIGAAQAEDVPLVRASPTRP